MAAETIVVRDPGAAGYGRHAAPASAYGPADVHRLLPVPPSAPRAAVRPAGSGTGPRPSEAVPARTTGLLARLRLLPGAA
ncbi:hypothetical protein BD833_107159 [Blastococcus xanthinilyticus]|uniref:Uncharacterized protein n=1 Tax=Blastococcus xanthinilyticus TaxID=1564164 RepID=A0A5S5CXX8_9ACTN|nr:hypothetical protein BD833_107159 [Blastococcus xanthinilyticus]